MTTSPPPADGWPKTEPPPRVWRPARGIDGPGDPRHGRRSGYLAGCRDECCTVAAAKAMKRARLRKLERGGASAYVDAAAAEAVAIRWARYGVSPGALASAAGLNDTALIGALNHHGMRVHYKTVRRLEAVTWESFPDITLVLAALTRARVQSLQAAGFPLAWVTERVPSIKNGGKWRHQARLALGTARAVQALYESAPLAGPSKHVATKAARYGYLHPLAWDDPGGPAALHDWRWEPARVPKERLKERLDMAVVWRRLNGDAAVPMSRRERIEVVRIARDENGWTERLIRDVTGIAQAWDQKRYPKREEGAEDATGVA